MMQMDDPTIVNDDGRRNKRNRLVLYLGIFFGIVGLSVGLYLAFGGKKEDNVNSEQREALRKELAAAMTEHSLDSSRLTASSSYQSKAMSWLLTDPNLASYDRSQVLQKFTLACFFYATNGIITDYTPSATGWKDTTGWLTEGAECNWLGIQCSTKGMVNSITLENNGLTGALPKELILLKNHITALDLTSNLMYMDGAEFDVFNELTRLDTLLMDDNYLSSMYGLPLQFMSLTSLKKLRMSYNLFGGQLTNEMLQSWPKLTHLEIESNYLTGSLPTALGSMDQLIYLYIRRNSLKFNLNFLKTGKMTNLFAMWLDNNTIKGGIPTQIGKLVELASVSLTNAKLTGTIPSQMENLINLRRLWLYGNDLSGSIPSHLTKMTSLEVFEVQQNPRLNGTVPSGICSAVNASTYTGKSLVANCSQVSCTCCTSCE